MMSLAAQNCTVALIARAATLHRDLTATWATSTTLINAGRCRRRRSHDPRDRPIRGGSGSDALLITPLIADARLCVACIAKKSGVPANQIDSLLRTIARTLRLSIGPHRCDPCLQHKTTFSVTKDGHP